MKYIHIAGTNGKGSVAEYVSHIIMASGASCGCFTSPHLMSPTERMRINGNNIGYEEYKELMQMVADKGLAVNESLFAQYTAAAFEWFARIDPKYAVIETGLGGLLDPTNVLEDKIVLLTPISHDHMQYLGFNIKDIATEKCGIIKEGNIVISSKQRRKVKSLIEEYCKKMKAKLIYIDKIKVISESISGQRFLYKNKEYSLSLIGKPQPGNAAVAIECANQLGISYEDTYKGLQSTSIKSRSQYVSGLPPMIIDGAHNPAAISKLMQTVKTHFHGKKKVLLFACMRDKDYPAMVKKLSKHFIHVIIVSTDISRGADVHELKKLFSKKTIAETSIDIESGFNNAKKIAIENDAILIICGSLYLSGSKFIQNS